MLILPQSAIFVILQCWSVILRLLSAYWYERQLVRYQDPMLVRASLIKYLMGPGEIRHFCSLNWTSTHLVRAAMKQM